eukprot:6265063-Pyramimonas_sp.AAC.1
MAWRCTVIKHLGQHGFTRSLLEPRWWIRYDDGRISNEMPLEVDDFMIASDSPTSRAWLCKVLESRFRTPGRSSLRAAGSR